VLIAWMPGEVEPFALDTGPTETQSQNALVVPLQVRQVTGPLPAGFVAPRLVDMSGKIDLSQYGAAVQNGSLTYEFSVPTVLGTQISGLGIRHVVAQGPFPPNALVGPNGQTLATSEVWDWQQSKWVPIALGDNALAALPDGSVQSNSGLVRLRIQSANGSGFRVGSLWLEGSPGNS
jgi:hypothetical protein